MVWKANEKGDFCWHYGTARDLPACISHPQMASRGERCTQRVYNSSNIEFKFSRTVKRANKMPQEARNGTWGDIDPIPSPANERSGCLPCEHLFVSFFTYYLYHSDNPTPTPTHRLRSRTFSYCKKRWNFLILGKTWNNTSIPRIWLIQRQPNPNPLPFSITEEFALKLATDWQDGHRTATRPDSHTYTILPLETLIEL